jgi:hypothetical protein
MIEEPVKLEFEVSLSLTLPVVQVLEQQVAHLLKQCRSWIWVPLNVRCIKYGLEIVQQVTSHRGLLAQCCVVHNQKQQAELFVASKPVIALGLHRDTRLLQQRRCAALRQLRGVVEPPLKRFVMGTAAAGTR